MQEKMPQNEHFGKLQKNVKIAKLIRPCTPVHLLTIQTQLAKILPEKKWGRNSNFVMTKDKSTLRKKIIWHPKSTNNLGKKRRVYLLQTANKSEWMHTYTQRAQGRGYLQLVIALCMNTKIFNAVRWDALPFWRLCSVGVALREGPERPDLHLSCTNGANWITRRTALGCGA